MNRRWFMKVLVGTVAALPFVKLPTTVANRTIFKDTAGLIPAKDGDSVALMKDTLSYDNYGGLKYDR